MPDIASILRNDPQKQTLLTPQILETIHRGKQAKSQGDSIGQRQALQDFTFEVKKNQLAREDKFNKEIMKKEREYFDLYVKHTNMQSTRDIEKLLIEETSLPPDQQNPTKIAALRRIYGSRSGAPGATVYQAGAEAWTAQQKIEAEAKTAEQQQKTNIELTELNTAAARLTAQTAAEITAQRFALIEALQDPNTTPEQRQVIRTALDALSEAKDLSKLPDDVHRIRELERQGFNKDEIKHFMTEGKLLPSSPEGLLYYGLITKDEYFDLKNRRQPGQQRRH